MTQVKRISMISGAGSAAQSVTEPFLCWKPGHMHMTSTVSRENEGSHSILFSKITSILPATSHWVQQNAGPIPSMRKCSNTLNIIMIMNTQCSPLNSVHCVVTSSDASLWIFSKAEIPLVGTDDNPFVKSLYFHWHPEQCHKFTCSQGSIINP